MGNEPYDLTNKIALVTGSSRGIGASIAKLLAARGAEVIISSRKIESCENIVKQIRDEGGKATAIACHIGDLGNIAQLFNQVRERWNRLDILVNNAAANPYFGPILDTDPEAYQKTVDVNIRGYFYCTIEAAKLMKLAGAGSVINIASVNAERPGFYQGIYSISKAAIIAMTKAFAKECAPHRIRVNAILPGATDTKFASALISNPENLGKILPQIPMNRIAAPDEIAGAVLYFASDAASYTTGSTLTIDGGYLVN